MRQNGVQWVCSSISGGSPFSMLPNLPFSPDGSSDEWHQDGVRVHAAGMWRDASIVLSLFVVSNVQSDQSGSHVHSRFLLGASRILG